LSFERFQLGASNWEISTDAPKPDKWHRIDVSWDVDRGLELFVDQLLIGRTGPLLNGVTQPTDEESTGPGSVKRKRSLKDNYQVTIITVLYHMK